MYKFKESWILIGEMSWVFGKNLEKMNDDEREKKIHFEEIEKSLYTFFLHFKSSKSIILVSVFSRRSGIRGKSNAWSQSQRSRLSSSGISIFPLMQFHMKLSVTRSDPFTEVRHDSIKRIRITILMCDLGLISGNKATFKRITGTHHDRKSKIPDAISWEWVKRKEKREKTSYETRRCMYTSPVWPSGVTLQQQTNRNLFPSRLHSKLYITWIEIEVGGL